MKSATGVVLTTFRGYWMAPQLASVLSAIEKKAGASIVVTSGYRSDAEQAALYNEYKAGSRSGPVAKPGSSNHRTGYAVDVAAASRPILSKYGPEYGLYNLKGDPPHFDLGSKPSSFPSLYSGSQDTATTVEPAADVKETAWYDIPSYIDTAIVQPVKNSLFSAALILLGLVLIVAAFRQPITEAAGKAAEIGVKAAI